MDPKQRTPCVWPWQRGAQSRDGRTKPPRQPRAEPERPGRGRDEAALLGSLPGSRRRAPRRAAGASCAEPCRAAPCRARRAPQGRAELPAAGHPGCSRRPPRRHFRSESRGRCNSTAACVITSSKRLRPPSALPNRARSSSAGPACSHRTFDIQRAFFFPFLLIFFFSLSAAPRRGMPAERELGARRCRRAPPGRPAAPCPGWGPAAAAPLEPGPEWVLLRLSRALGSPRPPAMWQREHCKQQEGWGWRALAR